MLRADELGCPLLVGAANLADEDDLFGLGILLKQLEDVDKVGADDRIATDADGRGLAQSLFRQGMDHLVGQGAAARNEADGAGRVDVAGHDAHLGLARA